MTTKAQEIGTKIGKAIAAHTLSEPDMTRDWTGIMECDGDTLSEAGITADSDEWAEAEDAARIAYLAAIGE